MVNQLKGIDVREDSDAWHLHVSSGENWHDLVQYTLQAGICGTENLALILDWPAPRLSRTSAPTVSN